MIQGSARWTWASGLRTALGGILLLVATLVDPVLAADPEQSASSEAQGRELAKRLRTVAPEESSTHHAVLKIRGPDGRRQVPLTVVTRPGTDRWSVEYRIGGSNAPSGPEIATIRYQADAPPRYEVGTSGDLSTGSSAASVAGDRSLGGGDFQLWELGMEFLHWPEQRQRGRELSNGRWCKVLESRSGKAGGPVTVRSWIDEKLGILLSAEVYDGRNQRLKQFSVTQFREQGERWTCSVSMVDDRRGTKTELSFEGSIPK